MKCFSKKYIKLILSLLDELIKKIVLQNQNGN